MTIVFSLFPSNGLVGSFSTLNRGLGITTEFLAMRPP